MKNRKKHNKKRLRVGLVLNIVPLYREAVFSRLDDSKYIEFEFFCGNYSDQIGALTNVRKLSGFKRYLKNIYSGKKLIWQKGWWRVFSGGYDAFILTGNPGIRSNWLLILIAKLLGKRVYLWTHGVYGNENWVTNLKNIMYMKFAGNLLLYGHYAQGKLKNKGFKIRRMSVVYNSLDYDRQKNLREKYSDAGFMRNYFGNDDPVVAFVGRLTTEKSLNLLIEAVGILSLQGIGCNLILVGGGEQEKNLMELASKIGVEDRVWFYGECYDEEMIASVFQNSTLCVSPGNVGLTAVHSMAYGIPVITHNRFVKQMPEFEIIRRGYTGDFFKYDDSISLAEVMEDWLKKLSDNKERHRVKMQCYRAVDMTYNPDNQIEIITKRIMHDLL